MAIEIKTEKWCKCGHQKSRHGRDGDYICLAIDYHKGEDCPCSKFKEDKR